MDVLLNEVLYDPVGADGGYEFVELVAAPGAPQDASLAGWILETGNGSTGQWTVAWTGAPGQTLSGGLFVVGESGVDPRPQVVADLDLQNGPDACRLRSPAGEVDVVGWGSPLPASFYEGGAPAPDVASASLARLPDGADSGRNDVDFREAPPSPGDFNAPESLAVVERIELPPRGLAVGAPWTFRWQIRNVGRMAWCGTLRAVCALHPGETLASVSIPAASAVAPGAAAQVEATASPPRGAHLPRSDPASADVGALWRGFGDDLAITEIYARPADGDVEWIELESRADVALDLGALRLHDAAGSRADLGGELAPSAFAVVTADTARFVARWGAVPGALLVELAPWPALNHTGPATEVAEWVVVATRDVGAADDSTEDRLAAAAIPGGIEEGVSWERVSLRLPSESLGSWGPCLDPQGGTPGRRNSRPADVDVPGVAGSLVVRPTAFHAARDGAVLVVLRPEHAVSSCTITVFDSSGLEVASLAPWAENGGEHRAVWDGRTSSGTAAPLGLYLVCAQAPGNVSRRVPLVVVR